MDFARKVDFLTKRRSQVGKRKRASVQYEVKAFSMPATFSQKATGTRAREHGSRETGTLAQVQGYATGAKHM